MRRGVKKYITRAFKGYLKSAENGDAMSQTDENGDAVAQNNIGYCCKYGKRTDKDDKKAFGWYLNSALRINNQTTIHLA
ncbi:1899_t:CDS:2 [Rhizophagus irregularis]|nr:1899_t:CDS:2 [Rhizophagus irregularis]